MKTPEGPKKPIPIRKERRLELVRDIPEDRPAPESGVHKIEGIKGAVDTEIDVFLLEIDAHIMALHENDSRTIAVREALRVLKQQVLDAQKVFKKL